MSSGRRNSVRTGTIVKIVIGTAVFAVVIYAGIKVLRKKVDTQFASEEESTVESAEVTTGSISTTVSGSGTLAYEDSEDITLPSTVEITNYYVSRGDDVEAGELLASVNTTTLVSAMNDVQTQIDDLDANLADVADETIDDEIDATVDGRVKKIYVTADDDVATVMYDNGALILLSLDGEMTVDVQTDALTEGASVTVKTGDSSYSGTVEKVIAGTASVTLTDDGPVYDADAEVFYGDTSVGTGKLYIHKPLSVTGYAGTVSEVYVWENEEIETGYTLMTLTDTSYTANYDSLLSEREDLEEQLQDLLTIYKEGAVYAKEAGTIVSLTKGSSGTGTGSTSANSGTSSGSMTAAASTAGISSGSMSGTENSSSGTDTVFSISPNTDMNITVSVDESDILSLSTGQEATVTIDSLEDQTFTGSVTEINTDGTSSNGVTTYSAVITVPKEENMLAGMSADVVITIEGVDNALLIPEEALNKTSSTAYVYTSYDEETDTLGDMVEVTIGISNGNYVEITSGLSKGDTVYYNNTESDDADFGGFSGFGGMGGDSGMPDMGGSSGGNMPNMGGSSGNGSGSSSGSSHGGSSGGGTPGGMSTPGGN